MVGATFSLNDNCKVDVMDDNNNDNTATNQNLVNAPVPPVGRPAVDYQAHQRLFSRQRQDQLSNLYVSTVHQDDTNVNLKHAQRYIPFAHCPIISQITF